MTFLFLPIGISGSGKSTVAFYIKQKIPNLNIISLDGIRFDILDTERTGITFDPSIEKEVRERSIDSFMKSLSIGEPVFYDASNLSPRRRRVLITPARIMGYEIVGMPLPISADEAMRRSRNRGRCIPRRSLQMMIDAFKYPTCDEGFDYILLEDELKEMLDSGMFKEKK
jgi:predicted kinase